MQSMSMSNYAYVLYVTAGMLYYPPPEHTTEQSAGIPRRPGRPRKHDAMDPDMQMRVRNPGTRNSGNCMYCTLCMS